MSTHYVTLEELGHASSLEVEIKYGYTPGERMVMYYPDGSGYPGSPPDVEFIGANVMRWDVGRDERTRSYRWIWSELDRIAARIIEERWEHFRLGCLEAEAEREDDGGYEA